MKEAVIIILLAFLGFSCNNFLCGELSGEWKKQLERAKANAVNLKIENIPCEFYYINATVTSNHIDTIAIHSIHKYLYDEKSKTGWQVILVHNAEGKYLFSHKYNNSIYVQTGD
ncbi:MAG: hypothetical protein KF746_27230 [Chitinophagaceae bacterium]|nr:hypothetical protein [Chitinophagaceae bacterium]